MTVVKRRRPRRHCSTCTCHVRVDIMEPAARLRRHPRVTEVTAYEVARLTAPSDRRDILKLIWDAGADGLISDEIAHLLDMRMSANQVATRVGELRESYEIPLVEDSGRKRTTTKNRPAIVWVVPRSAEPAVRSVIGRRRHLRAV